MQNTLKHWFQNDNMGLYVCGFIKLPESVDSLLIAFELRLQNIIYFQNIGFQILFLNTDHYTKHYY